MRKIKFRKHLEKKRPMGRPKMKPEDTKQVKIEIRVKDSQKAMVKYVAEKHGMTMGECLMRAFNLVNRQNGWYKLEGHKALDLLR